MRSTERYSTQQVGWDDIRAVLDVLNSPWLTQGPMVERFEAALAEYVGAKHAVVVSSGTAALHLAYMAVGFEQVQTSPLSFVATANAALLAGCRVSFFDVDSDTGNIDGAWAHGRIIVVPVHYAGKACQIPTCEGGGFVVEDACHALGAMDFDGCSRVGSCAHSLATCFSFHPVKPITCGEGGAVTTNDEGLADELRMLRSHGRDRLGLMMKLGLNYRMDEMSAALGLSQLKRCDMMWERRRELVRRYGKLIEERVTGKPPVVADVTFSGNKTNHAWHLYPIRIAGGRRDEVMAKLNARGIGAQVHYSPIIPLQPYYRERFGYRPGTWPNAEAWAAEELSLPLHCGMTEADVDHVCDTLARCLE